MADILYIVVFSSVFVLIGVCAYYDHKLKMPPAPTLPWARRKVIDALKKHVQKEPVKIIELGSGWGGLTFKVARSFPQSSITGFELSPFPYWFSKLFGIFHRNVVFERKDIFNVDLSGYDVVIYYLSPFLSERLSGKFKEELKLDTLIISSAFELKGFEPVDVLKTSVIVKSQIYVYRMP